MIVKQIDENSQVELINFNEIADQKGSLVALEQLKNIPFEIKRVYYIFNTEKEGRRGFHAHRNLKQILICVKGSCRVLVDDGKVKKTFLLNKPSTGLYIGTMKWREMYEFSDDCVLMVLASDYFNENDYIREYDKFLAISQKYYIHDSALVESTNIGEGTRIWAFAHILRNSEIGKNCNICDHTFIENDVKIGDRVTIKSGVFIWDGVQIANDVFIGPNVTFTNDMRPRSKQYPEKFLETIIEEGASIGANSTIVGGVRIGKYAMIGAGSVVTKNIPNNTLWYGHPAKMMQYICDCGNKLNNDLNCDRCKKEYIIKDDIILGT